MKPVRRTTPNTCSKEKSRIRLANPLTRCGLAVRLKDFADGMPKGASEKRSTGPPLTAAIQKVKLEGFAAI